MSYEVEITFPAADFSSLRQKLELMGAVLKATKQQEDHYYNHPCRDFAQTDEAFRIRRDGRRLCLTYKGPKIDPATKTRREIEIPLGDGDDVASQTAQLIEALGFGPVESVRKTRECFDVPWREVSVEVVIDQVEGLGTFVEIEAIAEENDLEAARQVVLSLAKELELGQSERRSYLELLLEQKQQ